MHTQKHRRCKKVQSISYIITNTQIGLYSVLKFEVINDETCIVLGHITLLNDMKMNDHCVSGKQDLQMIYLNTQFSLDYKAYFNSHTFKSCSSSSTLKTPCVFTLS